MAWTAEIGQFETPGRLPSLGFVAAAVLLLQTVQGRLLVRSHEADDLFIPATRRFPLAGRFSGLHNFCLGGHLVPEFIVIGAVKASTTSFAHDFGHSPTLVWPFTIDPHDPIAGSADHADFWANTSNGIVLKEGHLFDVEWNRSQDAMLFHYPSCRRDTRLIATEAAPRYFMDRAVPKRIASWYPAGMKENLKFLMLLRDPVHRFHSDYHHAFDEHWCDEFYMNQTFSQVLRRINAGESSKLLGGTMGCPDRLEGSMYKGAIERWFANFRPAQFTVAPWLYNVAPGVGGRPRHTLAEAMWKVVGAQPAAVSRGTSKNMRRHLPLEAEVDPFTLARFRSLLYSQTGPDVTANVLVQHPGAWLYGYRGSPLDRHAVAEWLAANW